MAINVRGLSEHRPWPGYSAIHNAGQEPQQGQRVLQTLGTPKTLLPTPKYKVPHIPAHTRPQLPPDPKDKCPWLTGNPRALLPKPEPWRGEPAPPSSEHPISLGLSQGPTQKGRVCPGLQAGGNPTQHLSLVPSLSPVLRAAPDTKMY